MDLITLNDISFWKNFSQKHLNGAFTVGETEVECFDPINTDVLDKEKYKKLIIDEGYCDFRQLFTDVDFKLYSTMVEKLHENKIPPLFLSIYDQFWLLVDKFENIVKFLIGDKATVLPSYFVWMVDPSKDETGFGGPHRDSQERSLNPDGSPQHLSLWLALSEANEYNGCMYILPANRDPYYNRKEYKDGGPEIQLCDVRALPCKAGDLFAWNSWVLHWSGRSTSSRDVKPRSSLAFEYVVNPYGYVPPDALSFQCYPTFETRKNLIAAQIYQYRHMTPWPELYLEFAKSKVVKDPA